MTGALEMPRGTSPFFTVLHFQREAFGETAPYTGQELASSSVFLIPSRFSHTPF